MSQTPVPWEAVFGSKRPVEVEIGPGHGDVLVAFATARPQHNFFAIEHHAGSARALMERIRRHGIANVHVIGADARCVLRHLVGPASVAAFHIYFPDPWPKNRHRARRLLDADFAALLARTLAPGGCVHVATDLPDLFKRAQTALAAGGLVESSGVLAPPRPRTWFERKYGQAGTWAGSFHHPQAAVDGSPRPQKTS